MSRFVLATGVGDNNFNFPVFSSNRGKHQGFSLPPLPFELFIEPLAQAIHQSNNQFFFCKRRLTSAGPLSPFIFVVVKYSPTKLSRCHWPTQNTFFFVFGDLEHFLSLTYPQTCQDICKTIVMTHSFCLHCCKKKSTS